MHLHELVAQNFCRKLCWDRRKALSNVGGGDLWLAAFSVGLSAGGQVPRVSIGRWVEPRRVDGADVAESICFRHRVAETWGGGCNTVRPVAQLRQVGMLESVTAYRC